MAVFFTMFITPIINILILNSSFPDKAELFAIIAAEKNPKTNTPSRWNTGAVQAVR